MKIAVVTPRFGEDIKGGAEIHSLGLVRALQNRGHKLEIFTSCAKDHYTWENDFKPGSVMVDELKVHRFKIELQQGCWGELESKLILNGHLPVNDQYLWLEKGLHSPDLYQAINKHKNEFDVFVFMPYLLTFVQYALWSALGSSNKPKTLLIPCLHDEPYAYMEWVALSFESVNGVFFNTHEERDLAINTLGIKPKHLAVLGEGILNAENVIKNETTRLPQLAYVGRLEQGKNINLLYQYMQKYYEAHGNSSTKVKLIVAGTGPEKPPNHPAFEFRGAISNQEKDQLCASSIALCQPSLNESFSIVIMESWLQRRPALVHGDCSVTRGHVQRSKGGLWFNSYEQFSHVVDFLKDNPSTAAKMGENGFQYVTNNYTWSSVARRFESYIDYWFGN